MSNSSFDARAKDTAELLIKDYPNGFDMANLTEVLVKAMKIAGEFKDFSGSQKKDFVIKVLNEILRKTNAGQYDKEIDLLLSIIIPMVIDALVSVENGEIKINPKTKAFALACFNSCKNGC